MDTVTKEEIGALALIIGALGTAFVKIFGSGKEKMDFSNLNRDAVATLLKTLQDSYKSALVENEELRHKWNEDLTKWELKKKTLEDENDEFLKRAISAETRVEFLLERIKFMETLANKNTDKQ